MLEKLLLALVITLCLNLFWGAKLPSSTNNTAMSHLAENSPQIGKWLASLDDWQQYESPLYKI